MIKFRLQMAEKAHCPLAETLRLMIPAQMRGGRVREKTGETAELAVPREEAEEAARKEKRSPKRQRVLQLLAEESPRRVSEIAEAVPAPRDALNRLRDMGLIRLRKESNLIVYGDFELLVPDSREIFAYVRKKQ